MLVTMTIGYLLQLVIIAIFYYNTLIVSDCLFDIGINIYW